MASREILQIGPFATHPARRRWWALAVFFFCAPCWSVAASCAHKLQGILASPAPQVQAMPAAPGSFYHQIPHFDEKLQQLYSLVPRPREDALEMRQRRGKTPHLEDLALTIQERQRKMQELVLSMRQGEAALDSYLQQLGERIYRPEKFDFSQWRPSFLRKTFDRHNPDHLSFIAGLAQELYGPLGEFDFFIKTPGITHSNTTLQEVLGEEVIRKTLTQLERGWREGSWRRSWKKFQKKYPAISRRLVGADGGPKGSDDFFQRLRSFIRNKEFDHVIQDEHGTLWVEVKNYVNSGSLGVAKLSKRSRKDKSGADQAKELKELLELFQLRDSHRMGYAAIQGLGEKAADILAGLGFQVLTPVTAGF